MNSRSLAKTWRYLSPVVLVLIGAAAQAQFQTEWAPWARWLTTVVIVAFIIASLGALTALAAKSLLKWRRARQIESSIYDEVAAVATLLNEALTSRIAIGAEIVLNSLCDAGQLIPAQVSEYGFHLGTLFTAANDVSTDLRLGRLRATEALRRVEEFHHRYIRLCSSLAPAVAAAKRPDLQRDWDAIRERANAISDHLITLIRLVESRRGIQTSTAYFNNVPRG